MRSKGSQVTQASEIRRHQFVLLLLCVCVFIGLLGLVKLRGLGLGDCFAFGLLMGWVSDDVDER